MTFEKLMQQIRACTVCKSHLPLPPLPLIQAHQKSKLLIVGQAPGLKTHHSGRPWDDASGVRLREWLGINEDAFYNAENVAVVPMGFCYPGKASTGDLPPRPECAPLWLDRVLGELKNVKLTLLVGSYAQKHFLKGKIEGSLTSTVRNWRESMPEYFPLPHPSPLNNIWLAKNKWFERNLVPELRRHVGRLKLSC